jgi:GNAT superfamily N-acetyltransferase
MDVTLRRATEADVPDLARLHIIAAHGIVDVLYHDLVPGVPTEKLFEWRFTQAGSVKSYEYCWVARQGSRTIGMVHAYPIDDLAHAPSDPRLTPECRGSGIGNRLMALSTSEAQQRGFTEVSLMVFEQNSRAVALYRRLGFEVAGRSPVVPHPLLHHTGDLLLMMRRL